MPFQSTPGESTPDQRQLLGDSAITPLPPLSGTKSLDHNITLPRAWHKQASLESALFERVADRTGTFASPTHIALNNS